MNTVVNGLLDVDKQARQLLDDAKQYYDKTIQELDQEKEAIRQEYADRAAKHIAELRQSETASIEEAVARINTGTADKIRWMDEEYALRHAQWEDGLFRQCTRR